MPKGMNFDALYDAQSRLRRMHTRHEQGAA